MHRKCSSWQKKYNNSCSLFMFIVHWYESEQIKQGHDTHKHFNISMYTFFFVDLPKNIQLNPAEKDAEGN